MSKPFIKKIVLYFLFATFLLGIYFCIYGGGSGSSAEGAKKAYIENFQNAAAEGVGMTSDASLNSCADMLVRRGEKLVLYNSKNSAVPSVTFQNLDEYVAYLEKQRESGLRCPVLYLQEENNAQGDTVFRIRPTLDNLENGLPPNTTFVPGNVLVDQNGGYVKGPIPGVPNEVAPLRDSSRDNPPYNQGGYAPFDPYGQSIGEFTEVDDVHRVGEKEYMSDNPMDPNWGGPEYSKAAVLSGKYDENLVMRPNLITPKN